MKKRLLLSLASACIFVNGFAQLPTLYAQESSESVAHYDVSGKSMIRFDCDITTPAQRAQMNQDRLDALAATNPNYAVDRNNYEQAIQTYLHNQPAQTVQSVVTLPVVVHVVYKTAAQNIPDNQVLSQIQVLNEDFGRTNADQNTHWSQAVNTTIQFCLAQRDPNGAATTGIERRSTTVTSFGTNDNVKHYANGGLDAWDPTRYLNIWVCNLGSGLLGYGEFPTSTVSQTMGVVILYSAFGSNYTSYGTFTSILNPYDRGRTTTHEFSHCFNLYHIWGDDGGSCTGSDLCADTPNQADATTTCFTFPHTDGCTSSGNGIMFENYMDYSYDNCLNLFTANQKTRMLAVLNTAPYNGLTTSNGCQAPAAAPVAAFTMSASSVCVGTAVSFTDNSTNSPTSWSWTFPGGSPASSTAQNPSGVTWATAGTRTVTLIATNGSGSNTITHTITVNALPTITTTASSTTICAGSSTTLTGSGGTSYTWNPGALTGTSVTVTPAVTTTYTVTGTNANGCTNTATRTITVNPSPTVTATSGTTTICSGNSTTLTGSGATSYTWNPGALTGTTVTVSPTTTTTYTVTGTGANGCTNTVTRTITVNPTPTVTTTTSTTTICSGNSATITASGATTYTWMPGALSGSPVTVSPTTTTTYTVTGTSSGCSGTSTRIITVNPSPTVTATSAATTICSGNSTTLTASGGTSYTWTPGALTGTTVTVSPATTTTYTVTGTSANGCTNTATRTITVNPTPTVTTTTPSTTICSGNSATITASGATTYTWMPGSLSGSSVTVSPTTTTTYTVTGTSSGCSGTSTRIITVNPTPTVTTTSATTTICPGNSTTITASGASTYSWNPGALSGTTVTVSPAGTTTYTVTGTSANGCTNTATRTITVNPAPTVTATSATTTICSGNNTTLTASGATSYTWNPGALTGTTVTVSPATTTTYTVTGTGANGCTNTATRTITVNPTPTVTTTTIAAAICAGNSTTITASGASTYSWMPGALSGTSVSVSPSSTTTYTVTGTSSGCTNTATRTITVNPSPTVTMTASNATICAGNNTSLTASGATSYTWNPGALTGTTVSVSPASTTTYTVTGTSANGCTNTATQTITVNALPAVTASASNSSVCSGNSVTLSGNGATTYSWMPGNLSGASVTDTPAASATYTVTGTDANGCVNTATVGVTVNALPNVTVTAANASVCEGDAAMLTASGANSYSWMPGNLSGATVTDVPAASTTYTVTGTDANGCNNTAVISIAVNPLPTVTSSASNSGICAGSSVSLSAGGASSYSWQPVNLTGANISDAPAASTTYTVTGTDANGCTNTSTVNVVVNPLPNVSISGNTVVCEGAPVTLTGNGATIYNWMPGNQAGSPITDNPATTTTYTLTGVDGNGCINTATFIVTVDTPPSTPSVIVNGSTLTSSITGASYQWFLNGNPIAGATAQSYTATQTGNYTVEVYDAAGCGSGQSSAVTDPTGIAASQNTTFFTLLPNPSDGHFELRFNVTTADTYTIEITNALGQIVYVESLGQFSGAYDRNIDLSSYGKGVYTIRLKGSKSESVIRAVTY